MQQRISLLVIFGLLIFGFAVPMVGQPLNFPFMNRRPEVPLEKVLDEDSNNEISVEEIAAAPANLLKLDLNQDGILTSDEFRAPPNRRGPGGGPNAGPGGRGPGGQRPGGGPGGPNGGGPGRGPGGQRPNSGGEGLPAELQYVVQGEFEEGVTQFLDIIDGVRDPIIGPSRNVAELVSMLAEAKNTQKVTQLGTAYGYVGLALSKALKRTHGKVTAYEKNVDLAHLAKTNLQELGVTDIVTIVELDSPISESDMIYVDANNLNYLEKFQESLDQLEPGGMVIVNHFETTGESKEYATILHAAGLHIQLVQVSGSNVAIALKRR